MKTDYHTHTPLCLHAEGSPEEYARAAAVKGLSEYGIADHAPMEDEPFDEWRMTRAELPLYFEWIDRARAAAPEGMAVRAGLECDWLEGMEKWTEQLAGLYPWDYLIGSVHYLGGKWDFDNPLWIPKWQKINVEEVWDEYWKIFNTMAATGLFDIMGHADLVKKFGFVPGGDLNRYYTPAIEAMLAGNCILEINTAGWTKPCQEAYPSPDLLRLACEAGIPLVINSDAHSPGELGREFDRAYELAKDAGYTEMVRLEKRRREFIPIPS